MKVGFSPKPTSGTAIASTATGGKVWPIFTRLRDSGRNSWPEGRVTKMPSATASDGAGQRREEHGAQMRQGQRQQAALVVDRRRIVHRQRLEGEGEELRRRDEGDEQKQRRSAQDQASRAHAGSRP